MYIVQNKYIIQNNLWIIQKNLWIICGILAMAYVP